MKRGSSKQVAQEPKEKTCLVMYSGDEDYGIWLRGLVNGHPVSLQFSNNSANFISSRTVERLGLATTPCSPFRVATLAPSAGGTVNHLKVANLPLQLEGGYELCMDFAVIALERHDFIIGYELFKLCSSIQFQGKKVMVFDSPSGRGTITCPMHTGRPDMSCV